MSAEEVSKSFKQQFAELDQKFKQIEKQANQLLAQKAKNLYEINEVEMYFLSDINDSTELLLDSLSNE